MRDISTKFPEKIDDRLFFQDIGLEHLDIVNEYRKLIANGNYTQASNLLNNSDIDFYGAWVLNLLENRMVAIQTYLDKKNKPNTVVYSRYKPTTEGKHWIG